MSGINPPNRYRYQYVPPSQVDVVLGLQGGPGDYLHRLIIRLIDPGSATLTLKDGATVIPLLAPNSALTRGIESVEFNIASRNGPFMITTGAGVSVIAVGQTVG